MVAQKGTAAGIRVVQPSQRFQNEGSRTCSNCHVGCLLLKTVSLKKEKVQQMDGLISTFLLNKIFVGLAKRPVRLVTSIFIIEQSVSLETANSE